MCKVWTKNFKNLLLLFQAILFFGLFGCGDKEGKSHSGDMILAVRVQEAGNQAHSEQVQVTLLKADEIQSENSARQAVEEAEWVSIDHFNSQNLVFRESDQQELAQTEYDSDFDFASGSVFISGIHSTGNRDYWRGHRHNRDHYHNRDHRHNRGDGYHNRDHRETSWSGRRRHCSGRNCWAPYRHHRWVGDNRVIRWRCRQCRFYGHLYRRGRCVIPFTPVYGYYWQPRYQYSFRRRNRHHHRRYARNSYSRIQVVLYW